MQNALPARTVSNEQLYVGHIPKWNNKIVSSTFDSVCYLPIF